MSNAVKSVVVTSSKPMSAANRLRASSVSSAGRTEENRIAISLAESVRDRIKKSSLRARRLGARSMLGRLGALLGGYPHRPLCFYVNCLSYADADGTDQQ